LALRADASECGLDELENIGDHFAASLSTPIRHPLGEEKEICEFFFIPTSKEKRPDIAF